MTDPLDTPLAEQALALRQGALTAPALMQAALDRIAARDPGIGAVAYLDAGGAMQAAEAAQAALDAGEAVGPLHGLPLGVKDIVDVAGQPGTFGSASVDPVPAARDAEAVARLRAAGAIPLAKLVTYEFALTGPAWDQPHPPARNPWNGAHITGGSSSGSAAAVAGGLLRGAVGTDTGGSIRSPAAYCGVTGLKPTRGLVPAEGAFPLSPHLDCVGPLAATPAEAALLLEVMAGRPVTERLGQDPTGLRIGYARGWLEDAAAHPALLPALDDAVGLLSRLGMPVVLADLPPYAPYEEAASVILQAEALEVHAPRLAQHYDRYGRDARANLISGALLTPEDLAAARQVAKGLTAAMDAALAPFDVLICATTLGPALPFSAFEGGAVWTPMRTFPFNLTGHPAISVPCGLAEGLPLGLQIIGRPGEEARLCQIAQAFFEASLPLAPPLPPMPPRGQDSGAP